MSNYKTVNVDFDNLFDPDVVGDGPTAPGYKQNGTPLKYANIKYGTQGQNTGYKQNNVDIATLWAKKGSAQYETPDNGTTYSSIVNIPSGSSDSAYIELYVGGGQYQVWVYGRALGGSGTVTKSTYSIPSGVTQFKAALTFVSGSTTLVTKTDTAAWTNIPASLTQVASVVSGPRGSASGTVDSDWSLALAFGNGGTTVYSGTNAWNTETDGSS